MAPKSTVKIATSTYFPQYRRRLHAAVRAGVERGSQAGANAAASATPRGDGRRGVMPGHAAATIEPMQIQKRRRGGYRGGFGSYDPTILWLSHGTNGRRTKKNLRLRDEATRRMLRETKEGRGTGLRARPFMRRALVTVALPTAIATMRQNGSGRLG